MDNVLPRNGDAVRRARGAHNPAAFPTVMLPIQKREGSPAHGALGNVSVGLPWRQYNVAHPASQLDVVAGRRTWWGRQRRQCSFRRGGCWRGVEHDGV